MLSEFRASCGRHSMPELYLKHRSTSLFLVIAGLAAGLGAHATARAMQGGPGAAQVVSQVAQTTNHPPFNASDEASDLLARLKLALETGVLLDDDFYTELNLKQLFGMHYFFYVDDSAPGSKHIQFDDLGNIYVGEHGQPTALGLHHPILQRGTILFTAGGPGQRARVDMDIVTAARVRADSTFFADLLGPIFGPPGAITEGSPSVPPLHGRSYTPEVSRNTLGNRWIKYQFDDSQHLKRIDFRTLGDAAVTEIGLMEAEK